MQCSIEGLTRDSMLNLRNKPTSWQAMQGEDPQACVQETDRRKERPLKRGVSKEKANDPWLRGSEEIEYI